MSQDTSRISVSLSTKDRLLDAAEHLFAQNGIYTTSLRELTSFAGTNIASVNYHFGSKEGLLGAIFERRIKPVNEERMRLLDIVEEKFGQTTASIDAILFALTAPAMRCIANCADFARLAGRLQSDPNDELRAKVVLSQFKDLAGRILPMLGKACPHLDADELLWRMHFIVGSMCYTWTNYRDIDIFSGGQVAHPNVTELTKRLVLAARDTLLAPASKDSKLELGGIDRAYMLPDASLVELLGGALVQI